MIHMNKDHICTLGIIHRKINHKANETQRGYVSTWGFLQIVG